MKKCLIADKNRVLGRKSGPKRDENCERERIHNKELRNLYPLPNLIWVIKSKRLRWASHVTRVEKEGVI